MIREARNCWHDLAFNTEDYDERERKSFDNFSEGIQPHPAALIWAAITALLAVADLRQPFGNLWGSRRIMLRTAVMVANEHERISNITLSFVAG